MPFVERPEGVEIWWEEQGEGPLVVMSLPFFSYPDVFAGVIDDLAADHRVVVYNARGTGRSTRSGPYQLHTDARDLEALIEELGPPAVVVATGEGVNRSVKLAARRADLITAVVSPGGNPLGRQATEGTDALSSSDSVLQALVGMLETDYRSALRTMLSSANSQLDDDAVRERVDRSVEYCPKEAAAPRLRDWIADDSTEEARAMGDKLWILEHGNNPWFPIEVMKRVRELLPDAHVEQMEDGPISRPDFTTRAVRQVTGAVAARASGGRGEAL